MASTDLSSSCKHHVHTPVSLRKPLRCGLAILVCSCLFFGASHCRAQETQDAAEAARKERERKGQPKQPNHVYTEDDLTRARILTPEDDVRFAASGKEQIGPADEQAPTPLDASADIPQLSLGDIARRYRDAKRAMQAPTPFHLPFAEPAFASPIVPVAEPAPSRTSFSPAHPNLPPGQPNVAIAPAISSPAPLHRVDPFARRSAPAAPSGARIAPAAPSAVTPEIVPLTGVGRIPSSVHTVTVQPGDSLWKVAQRNLGRGSRWQELLAANTGIVNPMRLVPGTQIVVPTETPTLKHVNSDTKIAVQKGRHVDEDRAIPIRPRRSMDVHRASQSPNPRRQPHLRRPAIASAIQVQAVSSQSCKPSGRSSYGLTSKLPKHEAPFNAEFRCSMHGNTIQRKAWSQSVDSGKLF